MIDVVWSSSGKCTCKIPVNYLYQILKRAKVHSPSLVLQHRVFDCNIARTIFWKLSFHIEISNNFSDIG